MHLSNQGNDIFQRVNFTLCKLKKKKTDQDVGGTQDRKQTVTKLSNCITNARYNHTKGVGKKEL